MNRDIFFSLLALDSYNRGYDENLFTGARGYQSVQNEAGRRVGNAAIIDVPLPSGSVAAGFYAIAYELPDEVVISYRGTSFNTGAPDLTDVFNGWVVGAGIEDGAQTVLPIPYPAPFRHGPNHADRTPSTSPH